MARKKRISKGRAEGGRLSDNTYRRYSKQIEAGELQQAISALRPLLTRYPDDGRVVQLVARVLMLGGQRHEALAHYQRAIELFPTFVTALKELGQLQITLGLQAEAQDTLRQAVECQPADLASRYSLAEALRKAGHHREAVDNYRQIIIRSPQHIDALIGLATQLSASGHTQEGREHYRQALLVEPNNTLVLNNLGASLLDEGRYQEALDYFQRTLKLNPRFSATLFNCARCNRRLGHLNEAHGQLTQLLEQGVRTSKTYYELTLTQRARGDLTSAYNYCREALKIDANVSDYWNSLGNIQDDLGRTEQAVESHKRAIALDPNCHNALLLYFHNRYKMGDWGFSDSERATLRAYLSRLGRSQFSPSNIAPSFQLLAIVDDPQLHQNASRLYAQRLNAKPYRHRGEQQSTGRLKIAYLSADFREHPASYLLVELMELHDRNHFEIFALSYSHNRERTAIRLRMEAAVEHFIDVAEMSDREIADLITRQGIGIAVDLAGYTSQSRPMILSDRPAPVQLQYLGYPGTLANPAIDYMIVDRVIIPPTERQHYDESMIYMPHCYLSRDRHRLGSRPVPTREALGLPQGVFIFCCFNGSYKILPEQFASWCQILQQVPGAILWLLDGGKTFANNLRREAATHGVAPERLHFAPKVPVDDHLARISLADLTLDTHPYNAHTTASDSLWVGIPVLTTPGRSFSARVAASLLEAAGLPELITASRAQYQALAVELATNQPRYQALRERLARQVKQSPVFDTDRFRADLERGYQAVWGRYLRGEGPTDVDLSTADNQPGNPSNDA